MKILKQKLLIKSLKMIKQHQNRLTKREGITVNYYYPPKSYDDGIIKH